MDVSLPLCSPALRLRTQLSLRPFSCKAAHWGHLADGIGSSWVPSQSCPSSIDDVDEWCLVCSPALLLPCQVPSALSFLFLAVAGLICHHPLQPITPLAHPHPAATRTLPQTHCGAPTWCPLKPLPPSLHLLKCLIGEVFLMSALTLRPRKCPLPPSGPVPSSMATFLWGKWYLPDSVLFHAGEMCVPSMPSAGLGTPLGLDELMEKSRSFMTWPRFHGDSTPITRGHAISQQGNCWKKVKCKPQKTHVLQKAYFWPRKKYTNRFVLLK